MGGGIQYGASFDHAGSLIEAFTRDQTGRKTTDYEEMSKDLMKSGEGSLFHKMTGQSVFPNKETEPERYMEVFTQMVEMLKENNKMMKKQFVKMSSGDGYF